MSADEIFDKGITEFNLGNFKKALALFESALAANSNHTMSLVKKGNILGKFGKYADAVSTYDKALQLEPHNILALVNKGLALHYLEKYDEAISCYDEVLGQKPDNAIALYNKASSLIRQNMTSRGLAALEQAIKLDFSYKVKARFDVDFENMRKNADFKRLVF
jgi:tetratricopeptide (TPR) repeat protein